MSWWVESGVLDKGDTQKVQGRGASRTGLKTTDLDKVLNPSFSSTVPISALCYWPTLFSTSYKNVW